MVSVSHVEKTLKETLTDVAHIRREKQFACIEVLFKSEALAK